MSVLILFAGCDFLLDMFPDSETGPAYDPVAGDDSNTLLGYPSNINARNTKFVEREAYSLLYSYDELGPLWVSWHLDSGDMGTTPRKDSFKGDKEIPEEYRVSSDDFANSGFDKGHVCPNADRNRDPELQAETYYMTNMMPQSPNNNQQTWRFLEEYLQGLADANSEVYIIAGPAGTGGYNEDGEKLDYIEANVGGETKKINVPEYVWKVAIIMDDDNNDLKRMGKIGGCDSLAVIMPNEDTSDKEWYNFICTIDDVEELTGFDFLD